MKIHRRLLAIMLFAGLLAAPALAQNSGEAIGTSGKWKAYRAGSVCFITSEPTKLEGNYNRNNRGETRVFVTHHGDTADERGVVSSVAGYTFKQGAEVSFTIDGKKHVLFTDKSRAWSNSPKQDSELVAAMKRGNTLKVTGTSSRNNKTIDTYSLSGFTKAMGMIDKACAAG